MRNPLSGLFARRSRKVKFPNETTPRDLPAGQISVDSSNSFADLFASMLNDFNTVNPKYPLEYLQLIDTLSIVNPDLSQAISNIVLLANTGHMLKIEGSQAEEASKRLNEQAKKLYSRSAGIDGLINAQLSQIARTGALSVEWVPHNNLSLGIRKVQVVPTSTIRFVYDNKTKDFYPVQQVSNNVVSVEPIRLNTNTYLYYALDLLDDSPYAIPPMLSALESIQIQRDMIANLKFISKKLGLLGFLNMMISAPTQKPGESEASYKARCEDYLNTTANRIKNSFKEGIAVGFKDAHEFSHTSITGDARGAADLFKMNEEQVFSGMKTDPSMQGRNYSTSETYAAVVYEKMLSQHTNYQRLIKRSLEYGYGLDMLLLGIDASATVQFNQSKSVNAVLDAAAEIKRIQAARMLYEDGIVNQDQRARLLGYDTPDLDEPRLPVGGQIKDATTPPTGAKKPKEPVAKKPKNRTQQSEDSGQSLTLSFRRETQQYEFVRDSIIIHDSGLVQQ